MILNPDFQISTHFKLGEFTLMRRLKEHSEVDFNILRNIIDTAIVMDKIRDHFGSPIMVTSGYRNPWYNKLIGGASNSSHLYGMGCDFVVLSGKGIINCDLVREQLKPLMSIYEFSMEDLPGSNWVHIQTRKVRDDFRFFKP